MLSLVCDDCGKGFEVLQVPYRGYVCFKCHVGGIQLKFTYGNEDFHGPTVKQRQEQQMKDAKIHNLDIVPISKASCWS